MVEIITSSMHIKLPKDIMQERNPFKHFEGVPSFSQLDACQRQESKTMRVLITISDFFIDPTQCSQAFLGP
jgi:hypothetical protein